MQSSFTQQSHIKRVEQEKEIVKRWKIGRHSAGSCKAA